jgi:hypothetical protein
VAIRRAIALALLAACSLGSAAEPAPPLAQQRIKAAFLYKFTAYVDWPANAFRSADSPIVLGIAGSEAIAHELQRAVAGRTAAGRGVEVRVVRSAAEAASCCQMLFVAQSDSLDVDEWLGPTHGKPVLTVTDVSQAHPGDSVINFQTVDDHVRFDISRKAAERNHLQLRAQLLTVARRTDP